MHLGKRGDCGAISRDVEPESVDRLVDVGQIGRRSRERREEVFFEGLEILLDLLDGVHRGCLLAGGR